MVLTGLGHGLSPPMADLLREACVSVMGWNTLVPGARIDSEF